MSDLSKFTIDGGYEYEGLRCDQCWAPVTYETDLLDVIAAAAAHECPPPPPPPYRPQVGDVVWLSAPLRDHTHWRVIVSTEDDGYFGAAAVSGPYRERILHVSAGWELVP